MMAIANNTIHTANDIYYSAKDLFLVGGGRNKHRITFFLKNDKTKELIQAYEAESYDVEYQTSKKQAVIIIRGKGKKQGTYLCRELALAYATWISANFYLTVLRAFDEMMTRQHRYKRLMHLHREYSYASYEASKAGYALRYYGREVKPVIQDEITTLEAEIQPQLPFEQVSMSLPATDSKERKDDS